MTVSQRPHARIVCALACSIVVGTVACSGPSDEAEERDVAKQTGENRPLTPGYARPPEPNPCIQVVQIPTDDGMVELLIQVPCALPTIDRGDPPPEALDSDALVQPAADPETSTTPDVDDPASLDPNDPGELGDPDP